MSKSIYSRPINNITPEVSRSLARILHASRQVDAEEKGIDYDFVDAAIERVKKTNKVSDGDRVKLMKIEAIMNNSNASK